MNRHLCMIMACAALLLLSACAYDPYYKPLAAHNYYADEPHYYNAGPGPRPWRYENRWREYGPRWDDDDRYRYYHYH